ncbi:MAG: hypothetical protein J0I36_02895, partial [Pandoraea sp.]|nr:hypothetical protein [Pandoraea sp.]
VPCSRLAMTTSRDGACDAHGAIADADGTRGEGEPGGNRQCDNAPLTGNTPDLQCLDYHTTS